MTARKQFTDEEHEAYAVAKRKRRMDIVDNLSPELRHLVHVYGFNVVHAFMNVGVQNPRHIRHLVETVLNDFSPTRASYSLQGVPKNVNREAMKPTLGVAALAQDERAP